MTKRHPHQVLFPVLHKVFCSPLLPCYTGSRTGPNDVRLHSPLTSLVSRDRPLFFFFFFFSFQQLNCMETLYLPVPLTPNALLAKQIRKAGGARLQYPASGWRQPETFVVDVFKSEKESRKQLGCSKVGLVYFFLSEQTITLHFAQSSEKPRSPLRFYVCPQKTKWLPLTKWILPLLGALNPDVMGTSLFLPIIAVTSIILDIWPGNCYLVWFR